MNSKKVKEKEHEHAIKITTAHHKKHKNLQNGVLAKMLFSTMNVLTGDFEDNYKTIEWTDNDGHFNRHNGLPHLEKMPIAFQLKYEGIFKYAQFFQKWVKPILAECIATFMLGKISL